MEVWLSPEPEAMNCGRTRPSSNETRSGASPAGASPLLLDSEESSAELAPRARSPAGLERAFWREERDARASADAGAGVGAARDASGAGVAGVAEPAPAPTPAEAETLATEATDPNIADSDPLRCSPCLDLDTTGLSNIPVGRDREESSSESLSDPRKARR